MSECEKGKVRDCSGPSLSPRVLPIHHTRMKYLVPGHPDLVSMGNPSTLDSANPKL